MKNKKQDTIPLLDYQTVDIYDHNYTRDGKYWKVKNLIDHAAKQKFPIFDIPLAGLNLNTLPFELNNLDDFIFQCKRVNNTDLKYPIILDDLGIIADGNHRVCKAILENKKTIKAIRLTWMPEPDKITEIKSYG